MLPPPQRGGRAEPALFPPLGVAVLLLCVCLMVLGAELIQLCRVGLALMPSQCINVEAQPFGASMLTVAHAMQGFGPLHSEPWAGQKRSQAACFIASRSC